MRQQDAARLAYETALAELKRQQAELMKLSTEVESIMNNEEQPVMLMDATDDIFLEVEEVEGKLCTFMTFGSIHSIKNKM